MAWFRPKHASRRGSLSLGGWCLRAALLVGATAALLGLSSLLGWLSRAQIDYLVG
jgi:hypothetical protein